MLCVTANVVDACYSAANDHAAALEWTREPSKWWTHEQKILSHVLADRALYFIYLDDYQSAEDMLDVCLPEFTRQRADDPRRMAYGGFFFYTECS
ncbi:hypothetical protein F5X96DRAFT_648158 [Biscogniauxia mediterranea]|nr:hypothetical protein F5X96DRAFT_648158 [Biscogniauxia mediterranea]